MSANTLKTSLHHISHDEARAAILSSEHAPLGDDAEAIVSHWLQDRSRRPILQTRSTLNHWQKSLSEVAETTAPVAIHFDVPFPPQTEVGFTFLDLFAGVGGFRIGLERAGGKCVFSSEIDPAAKRTYDKNFGEVPFGDIRAFTSIDRSDEFIDSAIPKHDVLAAGFPCQPFSRAGVSARTALGNTHGFEDETSGTLFFDIVRIAKVKRPKVLFLENVKNLVGHDGGRTFSTIKSKIEQLGYEFSYRVINSSRLVPQRRQRTYIIATRRSRNRRSFEFDLTPFQTGDEIPLQSVLETKRALDEYTISDALWAGHQRRTKANLARGTGFTAFTADLTRPANTLVARYGKDGKECLIPQGPNANPRLLTPRECARLQGFPEDFELPSARTVAYKQFGNSVAVPVITELARQIRNHLE